MSALRKIDLLKPLENFADERGKQLFEWAEQTWRGFLKQILQLMEGDDISDHDFTMMCDQLARVHSAQYPEKHTELLKDWAALVGFSVADIKAWEAGKNLPAVEKREAIVRQMLVQLVKHVRVMKIESYVAIVITLVNLQDLRNPKALTSVSPNTLRRSVHRLGLTRQISDLLFAQGLKTLGDLKRYLEPPPRGGLRISRDHRAPPRKEFDPNEKLQSINGIDKEAADEIIETTNRWDNIWPPSQLLVG